MNVIALIDDRSEPRETIARIMERRLRGTGWSVVQSAPLSSVKEYPGWVRENDVAVMVLDERLNEGAQDSDGYADYSGHTVAQYLREVMPDLPQFIVTNAPETNELSEAAGTLDAIIKRDEFSEKSAAFVERMVRAGSKFSDRFREDLINLDKLSRAIVDGTASQQDVEKIGLLRGKHQLESFVLEGNRLSASADELSDLCGRLTEVISKLEAE